MSQEIVVQPQPRAWLKDSILQPYVSRYGAHLRRGRYAPSTQRVYLCCVAHFAHWLTGERCGLTAIGEAVVARFLSEHLPACGCPYPVRRLRHELRAALAQLLEVLRADGVGALDPALDTAVAQELARFDAHMRDVWGLADSTRRRRGRVVGEFLLAHFGDRPITMLKISVASVRRFVLGEHGKDGALELHPTPRPGRLCRRRASPTTRATLDIATYGPSHHGDASPAVRCRHHRDRPLAGTRESRHDAYVP